VVEKVLLRLESQLDAMSQEEYDAFAKVSTHSGSSAARKKQQQQQRQLQQ